MCLHLYNSGKQFTAHVADEDIVVYKLLTLRDCVPADLRIKHPDAEYFSPFQCFPYKMGVEYTAKLRFVGPDDDGYAHVDKGLHTFKFFNDSEWMRAKGVVEVTVKGRIPKGSTYYLGTFSGLQSYASDKLILDEIVS